MEKAQSANGVSGHLIYIHGANDYMFRVYTGNGEFVDYDIRHCDLSMTITDPDSAFYTKKDGRFVLDHAPETTGRKDVQLEAASVDSGKQNFTRAEFEGRLAIHAQSSRLLSQIRSVLNAGVSDDVLGTQVRKILQQE